MRNTHRALAGAALAAAAVLVGTASAHAAGALPEIPEGQVLYVIGGPENAPKTLYTVATDGTLTEVGSLGITGEVRGADYDPVSGRAFVITDANESWVFNCDQLFSVDLETAAATLVGDVTDGYRCNDIDIDTSGVLRVLAYSNYFDMHVIDTADASITSSVDVDASFGFETTWAFLASHSGTSAVGGSFANEIFSFDFGILDSGVHPTTTLEPDNDGMQNAMYVADFDAEHRLWGVRWFDSDTCDSELVSMGLPDYLDDTVVHGVPTLEAACPTILALFFGPEPVEEEAAAAPALAETGVQPSGLLAAAAALLLGGAWLARRSRHTQQAG